MMKPNLKIVGVFLGIGGILAVSRYAVITYAKDPELEKAAEQALKLNRDVDEGLNPVCAKCEAIAGNLPQVRKPIQLFREKDPIRLELIADFDALEKVGLWDKTSKVSGVLRYFDAEGKSHDLPIKLAHRGNTKQMLCRDFKPLRVFFEKGQDLSDTPFKGISEDFKVATHCHGKGKIDESDPNVQGILKEYTAYQALDALGFMSLKTRLAQITYKKTDGQTVAESRAFLLEPKSNMAKRYGKKQIKQSEVTSNGNAYQPVSRSNLLPYEFSKQFLTHNDTVERGNHNGILVADKGSRKPDSVVPYDFDLLQIVADTANGGGRAAWNPDLNTWPKDDVWLRIQFANNVDNANEVENVARYALAHKTSVMKVIAESPAKDVSVMKKRAQAYFDGIEKVLKEREAKDSASSVR
jgi:hypothetical protein